MIERELDFALIGRRIKNARKIKGYTQEQLGEIIDMSSKNVSLAECGSMGLSLSSLVAICNALDVSLDYIVFGHAGDNSGIGNLLSRLNGDELIFAEKLLQVYVESCEKKV